MHFFRADPAGNFFLHCLIAVARLMRAVAVGGFGVVGALGIGETAAGGALISRLQPAIVPVARASSSSVTKRLQVPFGSVPLNTERVVPVGAGAGAGKVSMAGAQAEGMPLSASVGL